MTDADFRNALPLGQEIQGYRLDSVLGTGGFGITYKALELSVEREVAIKEYLPTAFAMRLGDSRSVVPVSKSQSEDFAWGLSRFKQEAQVQIKLRHPNIVPVLRFFEENGTAYMVMEYQQGDSLGDLVLGSKTITQTDLDRILPPILDALQAVHDAGYLHRDLKPYNIYIREDGSPVLLDFGAARQAVGQRSQSLTAIVSEGYAPYEQYERDGNQGPWTDLYALGAVLYRCVTGERPVEAPARAAATMRSEPDPLAPPESLAADGYRPETFAAIRQAMRVLEKDRPQSVAEFTAYLDGTAEPDTVMPVSTEMEVEAPTTLPEGARLPSEAGDSAVTPTHLAQAAQPETSLAEAPTSMAASAIPTEEAKTSLEATCGVGSPPAMPVWKRPPVMAGAAAACLLLVVGVGFAVLSGGDDEIAAQDAAGILKKAAQHEADAERLRKATLAASLNKKTPAAGGPITVMFANRRLQTILPGRSYATLMRFRPGGGLSAISARSDRDGGDLRESGTWTAKGNAVCLKLSDWNDGKVACFVVKHQGTPKDKKVRFNASGAAGSFRGTLAY